MYWNLEGVCVCVSERCFNAALITLNTLDCLGVNPDNLLSDSSA